MQTLFPFPASQRLKAAKIGIHSPAIILLSSLFMTLLAAATFWWATSAGKDIYRDYQIGKGYHEIPADIASNSKCKTSRGVFTDCTVYIRHEGETHKQSFWFFDSSSSDYTVIPVASDSDPSLISIDLAVKNVGNRTIMMGIVAFFGLVMAWLALYGLFVRLPRVNKILAPLNRTENQPWQLVALRLDGKGNKYYTVLDGKPVEMAFNFKTPWYVQGENDEVLILGIAPKNGGAAIPLDEKLTPIRGLGKQERNQLLQTLRSQLPTA